MACYSLFKGNSPLLISMPHIGQKIPADIACLMTEEAHQLKDTDWYVDNLYDFSIELGASCIKPENSRYVIDLNRGIDGVNLYPGANSTELCPLSTFNLSPIYRDNKPLTTEEVDRRITQYWLPYHHQIKQILAEIKAEYGFAILLDAHSILSEVPRFFEGQLPDFNWGTANGESCSEEILEVIKGVNYQPYSMVCNQRFKGGYITREYGDPKNNIHAIQLELSQKTYMNEDALTYNETLAEQVKPLLKQMVEQLIQLKPKVIAGGGYE